jgi:Ser/Thr protein kinase RdoA (MazF antagonist)
MNPADKTMNPIHVESPNFSVDVLAATVAEKYNLHGEYSQLISERDQNFRLKTTDGRKYVVKVTSLLEDSVATDFQIAALSHFETNNFNRTPRVVPTVRGEKRSVISADNGQEYSLRVVSWLDGALLRGVELTTDIVRCFGQRLAEMDLALRDFDFVGDGQAGLWDTQEALQLTTLLPHVNDENVQQHARAVLTRFGESTVTALCALPRQAIHNDANPENILLDASGDVSGFIDFGDALKAPRIIEVATAAAYLRTDGENPLKFIEAFVKGYHQRSPLLDAEFDLLFDLIRTRLTMTVVLMYWRLSAREENDPYRQKTLESEGDAFAFLVYLSNLGRDVFDQRVRFL